MIGLMVSIFLLGVVMPQKTNADFVDTNQGKILYILKTETQIQKISKKIKAVVTAYSSTPDQTDSTPFITASGKPVAENIVANNMLPFGTKIRIPELYGDKVFIVGDRMNKRMGDYRFDLWMTSRSLALNFGVKTTEVEILEK